jgi:hypothetical protein
MRLTKGIGFIVLSIVFGESMWENLYVSDS